MDRERFRKSAHDLKGCADLIRDLTRMPDRATEKDFQQAADLMARAADDITELIKAQLPGCICRRIQDDGYDYLDYAGNCRHHRDLYLHRESLKADYAKIERALKNETRMKLVAAALSGTAGRPSDPDLDDDDLVKRAIAIADEAIRRITQEDS